MEPNWQPGKTAPKDGSVIQARWKGHEDHPEEIFFHAESGDWIGCPPLPPTAIDPPDEWRSIDESE